MSKHVFVSHSHNDEVAANAVVTALEQRGINCWIAPRDVAPGGSYAEAILTAIETAACFVLIYSEHCNVSSHVLREVERALKFGVNIVPIRFDNSRPSKSLDYLLATVHWLAIPAEARECSIAKAAEQIAEWLKNFLMNPAMPLPVRHTAVTPPLETTLEQSQPRRGRKFLGFAAMLLVLGAIGAYRTDHLPFAKKFAPKSTSIINQSAPPVTTAAKPMPPTIPSNAIANRQSPVPNEHLLGYGADPSNFHPGEVAGPRSPQFPAQPMPPNANNGPGPGFSIDGRYPPPPPPPPPPGRSILGPGNGPGGPPPSFDGSRP